MRNAPDKAQLKKLVRKFARLEGRQPRAMVSSRLPLTGDEKIEETAVLLADLGFNVDIGPFFKVEQELVANAVENDVDVLIVSKITEHSRNQAEFIDNSNDLLNKRGRKDLLLIHGSHDLTDLDLIGQLESALAQLLQ